MTQQTIDRIRKFTEDRDWDQFHSPANLAKSISIEAGELLECFQWDEENFDLDDVKEELAKAKADVDDAFERGYNTGSLETEHSMQENA